MRRLHILPVILVSALLLAACGVIPTPTPERVEVIITATPDPASQVTPTPVIIQAPTVVIIVTATPDPAADADSAEPPAEMTSLPTPLPASPIDVVERNEDWEPTSEVIDGIEYALVPPGCFQMGDQDGYLEELPQHEVCFEQPFYIAVTETTNEQFGSRGSFPRNDFPRNDVTWFDALEFCQSIGARLPTEAEWEYAARGPSSYRYPFGDSWQPGFVIQADNSEGANFVGSLPGGASWVGALDMAGNVREWTLSAFEPYPYNPTDGREALEGESRRVVRGGSWQFGRTNLRMSIRQFNNWNADTGDIGFRCARNYGG